MPDTTTSPPDLTILILCLDEEESIAHCVGEARSFLETNAIHGEVVVVDNDSADRSAAVAKEAGARVVTELQRGYGNAIIAGIEAARGRFVILSDGDGEYSFTELEPFWEKLRSGKYDFVIGNRFADGFPEEMGLLHKIGNFLLSGVGNLLFRSSVKDFHCGTRGFTAAAARSLALQCPGMECASEIVVKATLKNMRITEVPIGYLRAMDPRRVPHLRTWRDGWRHLRFLLALSPKWTFFYPGCAMFAAGALVMAAPVAYPAGEEGGFGAYTMMLGSAFVICGAQSVIFSLLARVFCENIGLTDERWTPGLQKVRLAESGLVSGFILAAAGAAGSVWSLFVWAQSGGADLEARLLIAVPSVTLLVLGVQLVFSGFFLTLVSTQKSAHRLTRKQER